mmetsp:Transcript_20379/g.56892  ORF Transcript_20379/g.56892 Transcript_20379/m.56892 type:complete len:202 (-) Transcript_20379:561-1166(-)
MAGIHRSAPSRFSRCLRTADVVPEGAAGALPLPRSSHGCAEGVDRCRPRAGDTDADADTRLEGGLCQLEPLHFHHVRPRPRSRPTVSAAAVLGPHAAGVVHALDRHAEHVFSGCDRRHGGCPEGSLGLSAELPLGARLAQPPAPCLGAARAQARGVPPLALCDPAGALPDPDSGVQCEDCLRAASGNEGEHTQCIGLRAPL